MFFSSSSEGHAPLRLVQKFERERKHQKEREHWQEKKKGMLARAGKGYRNNRGTKEVKRREVKEETDGMGKGRQKRRRQKGSEEEMDDGRDGEEEIDERVGKGKEGY